MGWWLAGALALYAARLLRRVYLLDRVLEGYLRVPIFETHGLWPEMFARVEKIRAKARNRKKKYHKLLREVRESTGALSDAGIILNPSTKSSGSMPRDAALGLNPDGHRQSARQPLRHPTSRVSREAARARDGAVAEGQSGATRRSCHAARIRGSRSFATSPARSSSSVCGVTSSRTRRTSCARRSPVIGGYLDALAEDDAMPTGGAADRRNAASGRAHDADPPRPDRALAARIVGSDRERESWIVRHAELIAASSRLGASARGKLALESDARCSVTSRAAFDLLQSREQRRALHSAAGTVNVAWRGDDGAVFEVTDTASAFRGADPADHRAVLPGRPGRSRRRAAPASARDREARVAARTTQHHVQSQPGQGSTFTCRFPSRRLVSRTAVAEAV
jgi:hypothetical protein